MCNGGITPEIPDRRFFYITYYGMDGIIKGRRGMGHEANQRGTKANHIDNKKGERKTVCVCNVLTFVPEL
jgi:hypothetical protein